MRLEPGIWQSCLPIAACRRSFCALPSLAAPLWGGSLQPRPLQWGQLSCPSSSPVWLSWPESSSAGYKREDQVSAAAQGSTAQDSADAPCKKMPGVHSRPGWLGGPRAGGQPGPFLQQLGQPPRMGARVLAAPWVMGCSVEMVGTPPASGSTTQTCLLSLPQPAGGDAGRILLSINSYLSRARPWWGSREGSEGFIGVPRTVHDRDRGIPHPKPASPSTPSPPLPRT